MSKEGKLIVFEGCEKVGKSTQIELLAGRLKKIGVDIFVTKEPRGSIREELLYGNPSPDRELDLFLKDRTEHFKSEILPKLGKGMWVLTDRCSPSTISYQHYGRGLDLKDIKRRDETARQKRNFDLVVLLDMDPELAMERIEEETRFEKELMDFHRRVRKGFLAQAEEDSRRWVVLDASQSISVVSEKIWLEIQKRFL